MVQRVRPRLTRTRVLLVLGLLGSMRSPAAGPQPASLVPAQTPREVATAERRLWLIAPTACTTLTGVKYRARELEHEKDRLFIEEGVTKTLERAQELLGDAPDADAPTTAAVQAMLTTRAEHLTAEFDERLDRAARRRYALGLMLSVAASMALLLVIYLVSQWVIEGFGGEDEWNRERPLLATVLVCVGGGAAGAMVSVLVRLSSRDAPLPNIGAAAGVYRVALGWFFAAATIFLVKGGIIGVFKEPDVTAANGYVTNWFFWGGVGFIAGFNERWARNLFTREPDKGTGASPSGRSSEAGSKDAPVTHPRTP